MGKAYVELLADKTALLFQMQSYAACSDPVIQARVREGYGAIVKEVTRLSGAAPEEVWQFFSHGMLLNVIASLDLAAIADRTTWARAWCEPERLIKKLPAASATDAAPPTTSTPTRRSSRWPTGGGAHGRPSTGSSPAARTAASSPRSWRAPPSWRRPAAALARAALRRPARGRPARRHHRARARGPLVHARSRSGSSRRAGR